MHALRAFAHLLLALVFVTAVVAQAHAAAAGPGTMSPAAHAMTDGAADHAAMGHGPAKPDAPLHTPGACQTACCLALVPLPVRLAATSPVSFARGVRYADLVQPLSGRICSPDPGVPKRAA